jgi:hypothetical protein
LLLLIVSGEEKDEYTLQTSKSSLDMPTMVAFPNLFHTLQALHSPHTLTETS